MKLVKRIFEVTISSSAIGQRQLDSNFLWLFSQIQNPVFCLSTNGKIIAANDQALALLQCPKDKVLRRSFARLLKKLGLVVPEFFDQTFSIENNSISIQVLDDKYSEWENWEWIPHLQKLDAQREDTVLILLGQQMSHNSSRLFKTNMLKESFRPSQLLEDLIEVFYPLAKNKSIKLHYKIADEVPKRIIGHRQWLYYVLWRLLNYLMKTAKEGEIDLAVKTMVYQKNKIVLHFMLQHIANSSINKEDISAAHIFQSEYETGSNEFEWSDNKFILIKDLIRDMNGQMEMDKQDGKTITFALTLPFELFNETAIWQCHEADTPYQNHSTKANLEASKTNLNILAIEDDVICQEVLREKLNEVVHCNIDIAGNAQSALNLMGKNYDLIFVDIGLPDKDGFILTRELRHRLHISTPIIAVTGYDWDQAQLNEKGLFNDVLKKPIMRHKLQRSIYKVAPKTEKNLIMSS
jgi:CheY-like chemotaxis protein